MTASRPSAGGGLTAACGGGEGGGGALATFAPPSSTIETKRFCGSRTSGPVFTKGADPPTPLMDISAPPVSAPVATRALATSNARTSDSEPGSAVSVCPTRTIFSALIFHFNVSDGQSWKIDETRGRDDCRIIDGRADMRPVDAAVAPVADALHVHHLLMVAAVVVHHRQQRDVVVRRRPERAAHPYGQR